MRQATRRSPGKSGWDSSNSPASSSGSIAPPQPVDARLHDHAAVADDGNAPDPEASAQALHRRQQDLGVAGVARQDRNRHRPHAGVARQAEVDLRLSFLAVAAAPEAGKRFPRTGSN
ncbi:MAG: hypothetical protein OXI01_13825 [Albidovulum sp.]|nr:hypothetical protein [Albidovulum sp.]